MTSADWYACGRCGAEYRSENCAGMCCRGTGTTEVVDR